MSEDKNKKLAQQPKVQSSQHIKSNSATIKTQQSLQSNENEAETNPNPIKMSNTVFRNSADFSEHKK